MTYAGTFAIFESRGSVNLWNQGNTMAEEMRIARMMKELQSDLADLVVSGDLTEQEANEWANRKADQWANGIG